MDGLASYLRPNVLYLSGFAPPASASVHETNGYAAVVISRHEPQHPIIVLAEFDLAHFLSQPSWITDARPYATLLTPFDVAWSALDQARGVVSSCRLAAVIYSERSEPAPRGTSSASSAKIATASGARRSKPVAYRLEAST